MAISPNEATSGTVNTEQPVDAVTQNIRQPAEVTPPSTTVEALSAAEVQQYEESAAKAMKVVMVQLKELLTEGFHTENPDPTATMELVKSRGRAEIQALLSGIYNDMSLIEKVVCLSALDSASQQVVIKDWNANALAMHNQAVELTMPVEEMKKIVKDLVIKINDETAMGALASSFAENYEKRDGKMMRRLEIFEKIKQSLEKNPSATAAEPLPANLAEMDLNMKDNDEVFDEEGLTDLLRDIYQVISSPQYASLQG